MKIYYDTEFLEDGETIALISIGLASIRTWFRRAPSAPSSLGPTRDPPFLAGVLVGTVLGALVQYGLTRLFDMPH
jgi:hypothetical protein